MLRPLKRPILRKKEERSQIKAIHLRGPSPAIMLVAERRAESQFCRQLPSSKWERSHHHVDVRVTYEIVEDGFVAIHGVKVLVNSKWVCFFNRSTGQIGDIIGLVGTKRNPQFIYLTENGLAEFVEAIGRVEDSLAIPRLTRLGPEIFPRRKSG